MKSDREFIDGIYEKARMIEKSKETTNRMKVNPYKRYQVLRPIFISCLLLFVVTVGIKIQQGLIEKPEKEAEIELTHEDVELNLGTRSIDMEVEPPIILTGKVIRLQNSKSEDIVSYATIVVDQVIQGLVQPGEEQEIQYYTGESGGNIEFTIGEKVLLYLCDSDEGYKTLENGAYGKYTFVQEEDGALSYESVDGIRINTKNLIEQFNH